MKSTVVLKSGDCVNVAGIVLRVVHADMHGEGKSKPGPRLTVEVDTADAKPAAGAAPVVV